MIAENFQETDAPAAPGGWKWERKAGAKVSLDALKAIGRRRLPKEVFTVARALTHYLDMKSTGVHAFDLALTNRVNKVRARLIEAIGKYEITQRPIEQMTRAEARKFRDYLSGQMSAASVKRTLEIVSPAINKLIKEHDLDMKNPFSALEIKGAANSRDARAPLTDTDMTALAAAMETDDILGTIWIVLRDTGARLGRFAIFG